MKLILLFALLSVTGRYDVTVCALPPGLDPAPQVQPETLPAPDTVERPIVYVVNAPFFCQPCVEAKAAAIAWPTDAPFLLSVTDDTHGMRPPAYPFVHWSGPDGKFWYLPEGWTGREDLISRWRNTQRTRSAPTKVGRGAAVVSGHAIGLLERGVDQR